MIILAPLAFEAVEKNNITSIYKQTHIQSKGNAIVYTQKKAKRNSRRTRTFVRIGIELC